MMRPNHEFFCSVALLCVCVCVCVVQHEKRPCTTKQAQAETQEWAETVSRERSVEHLQPPLGDSSGDASILTSMPSRIQSMWMSREPSTLGSGERLHRKEKSSTLQTAGGPKMDMLCHCCGFCGKQGTCTVSMQRTTGSKASNQVHYPSCSNGMFCKFNTLSASKRSITRLYTVRCAWDEAEAREQKHAQRAGTKQGGGGQAASRCESKDPDFSEHSSFDSSSDSSSGSSGSSRDDSSDPPCKGPKKAPKASGERATGNCMVLGNITFSPHYRGG